jgi:glycosyltransferase involved in cell wall biosynthesis
MRILWHSNAPWARTGYGNQTLHFTNRIRALGHEVAISAFYGLEGGIIEHDGAVIYPKGQHPYGADVLPWHAAAFKADIVITLIDAWVYNPNEWPGVRWVPWFPVDMETMPPPVARAVVQAHKRIVYSRFAERMVNQAGMDCYYVPHGIDTKIFRPGDRTKARQHTGLPKDKFIVGIVGANKGNPPRKAWNEMIYAFAELRKRHDDVMLYVHTNPTQANQGINMIELFQELELVPNQDVMWPNQYRNQIGGFDENDMVALYNAFDVHLLASAGEGFGIPVVEAQACGCPVIVGDWTATEELCFSGWKIDKKDSYPFRTPLASFQFYPRVEAVVDALEQSYRMWGNTDYRKRARQGALAYDADKVTEKYWKPVLADIEASL